jgi:hypothetical protein
MARGRKPRRIPTPAERGLLPPPAAEVTSSDEVEVGDLVQFIGFSAFETFVDPKTGERKLLPDQLQPGTRGRVAMSDEMGSVHVDWEDGHRLGMLLQPFEANATDFKRDRFCLVPPEPIEAHDRSRPSPFATGDTS